LLASAAAEALAREERERESRAARESRGRKKEEAVWGARLNATH